MQKRNTLYFMLFMCLIVVICLMNINCGITGRLGLTNEWRSRVLIDPYDSVVHYQLANCYYREGNYKMAVYEFKQAIKYSSNYAEAHAGLGLAYYQLNAYGNAVRHLDIALVINPKIKQHRAQMVKAYIEMGHRNLKSYNAVEAIDILKKSLMLDRDNARAKKELACAYCMAAAELKDFGQLEVAKAFFAKALELDKKSKLATKSLSEVYVALGKQYQQDNQIQLAIAQFKEALQYNSGNETAKSSLAALQ